MSEDQSTEKRRYSRAILQAHPGSRIQPMSAELQAKADASDWPPELVKRVLALRRDRGELEAWFDMGWPTAEMMEGWVELQELLLDSTLSMRLATWEDSQLLIDVCRESPEQVGDWLVTVERSPNPFAQYRLQENPQVKVLEDCRIGLGMAASSLRNSYVGGERTTVHFLSGWRIRDGFRGLGFSHLLQNAAGLGTSWMALVNYWTARVDNSTAGWLDKVESDFATSSEFGPETDRLTTTATVFSEPTEGARSARVRPATLEDLPRCVELINQTHDGLDLFRPYSLEYLDQRLSDPSWGPKPYFYPPVYGLAEYRVLEVRVGDEVGNEKTIVACGGVWDRGRDIREIWVRAASADEGERHVVDPTALMDSGFAAGHRADMAELVSHLLAESADLGRSGLMAAIEFQPELAEELNHLASRPDVRGLHVMPMSMPDFKIEAEITKPYLDLAYW